MTISMELNIWRDANGTWKQHRPPPLPDHLDLLALQHSQLWQRRHLEANQMTPRHKRHYPRSAFDRSTYTLHYSTDANMVHVSRHSMRRLVVAGIAQCAVQTDYPLAPSVDLLSQFRAFVRATAYKDETFCLCWYAPEDHLLCVARLLRSKRTTLNGASTIRKRKARCTTYLSSTSALCASSIPLIFKRNLHFLDSTPLGNPVHNSRGIS